MCGRYTLYQTEQLAPRFNLAAKPKFISRDNYNVAPGQQLPVIVRSGDKTVAEVMKWGFVPFWSKDPTRGLRPINTVSESAFEKPMWREAVKHHRCLVPSRGFYEWKKIFKADGKLDRRQAYFIHPRDQELFAFAGIYSVWRDAEGHPFPTFSIMTTGPNKQMEKIHNRMPVILNPKEETDWLNPSYDQTGQLAKLLDPYDDGKLDIYRVSDEVNSPSNNDRSLLSEVAGS